MDMLPKARDERQDIQTSAQGFCPLLRILQAPAIWKRRLSLADCRAIFSLFYTASSRLADGTSQWQSAGPYGTPARLSIEEWVKAIVRGADEHSPRWRHVLAIGGLLLGFERQDHQPMLPSTVRYKLESALVQAVNLALANTTGIDDTEALAIVFVLNNTFHLLSDAERSQLQYEHLLPVLISATFSSNEGLQNAYFLGAMDRDVVQIQGRKIFCWSPTCHSFKAISDLQSKPLVTSLGPMARLISHAIEHVSSPQIVSDALKELHVFSRAMIIQWRQNKLSEIDPSEEKAYLDADTLSNTLPRLWRLLRITLFTQLIILRSVLGRLLGDQVLASDSNAPEIAIQCLHVLRNLYFISSRLGETSSSQYTFVNFAAIDILSQYPAKTIEFLTDIRPYETNQIPNHPLERCLDLFFLNTAEHFTSVLPTSLNEELVFSAAAPYLIVGGNVHLLEIFEAAHSVMLALFATPHCFQLTEKHLAFYIDTLFNAFPQNLSARQFRLALRTIIRVLAPPSPIANTQPLLPAILLELACERAQQASPEPLPTLPQSSAADPKSESPPLSEQAVLVLSILDSLCYLPLDLLKEWLPLAADLVHQVQDQDMKRICQDRFWEALSSGEMDVERAAFCVTWWTTQGGRQRLLHNRELGVEASDQQYLMSGGVGQSKI
ncbi:MAG: hypothetical protein Q9227_007811 [Pyrenula ochraceoflavens]